jgi:hypothetical protein
MSTTVVNAPTISSQKAIDYLLQIKPKDGWNVEIVKPERTLRLLRRNVPVVDNSFLDIHYSPESKLVVGIMTEDGATCQVLIDSEGRPSTKIQIVSVQNYCYIEKSTTNISTTRTSQQQQQQRPATASATPATVATTTGASLLTDIATAIADALPEFSNIKKQQLEEYIKIILVVLISIIVLKIIASSMILMILILPLGYVHGVSTCPPPESFDAKQQLKRVLRGYHLPDSHPEKPKGVLEEWTARIKASITTELVTLPGYTIEMLPLPSVQPACIWIAVEIPTSNLNCYWIGWNHRWYYIGSREMTANRPHQD